MQEEVIIRKEAFEFFNHKLNGGRHTQPIDKFHELKFRLDDFYSPEYKAIFLDEIQRNITEDLTDHRKKHHGGNANPECHYETTAEKLLFYINQEIGILPKVAHQKQVDSPKFERYKVFISYSHSDQDMLKDIQRHFKPFLSHVALWDDTKILPGQKWKEEIRTAINETKVAILLVSTDFLGSDFIATDELPPLLRAAEEDGAAILTLIARPCLFEEFPALNQYQAMNPPSKPISKMDPDEREELFVNLVRQTKRILKKEEG